MNRIPFLGSSPASVARSAVGRPEADPGAFPLLGMCAGAALQIGPPHAWVDENAVAEVLKCRGEAGWQAAAQAVIDGCAHMPDPQERMRLLERLSDELGPARYPALIGVLCTVGERASAAAQAAVADTLTDALYSNRLPTGRRLAWGSAQEYGGGAVGSLGPIEYLCAWHAEPNGAAILSQAQFDPALRALLGLLSQAEGARALYCERLQAVADDPLQTALSCDTRQGLRDLASTWEHCATDLHAPVEAFLANLRNPWGY